MFCLQSNSDVQAQLQAVKNLPALTDTCVHIIFLQTLITPSSRSHRLLSICLSRFVLHLRSVELSEDLSAQSLHLSHIPDLHLTRPNIVAITGGTGLSSDQEVDGLSRLPVEGVQDA